MRGFLSALRAVCRAIFIFPWDLCGDCEGVSSARNAAWRYGYFNGRRALYRRD